MNAINWLCGELDVAKDELLSVRRGAVLVEKRRIAVCVLRRLGWSFNKIGRELKRDHTTVGDLYRKSSEQERKVADYYAEVLSYAN